MRPFDPLLAMLNEVPDPRRAEGKLYKLPYVLLFSILAVVTGGNSFRSIETFLKGYRRRLNAAFRLRFRRHAARLPDTAIDPSHRTVSLDGKTLKQCFDNFNDRKAAQVLHAFNLEAGLVLAHVDIDEKSNAIPAAQRLLDELQLTNCPVTLDAMYCQKNPRSCRSGAGKHHPPKHFVIPGILKADTSVTKGRNRHEPARPRYSLPPPPWPKPNGIP
jgi:hypothetical protein